MQVNGGDSLIAKGGAQVFLFMESPLLPGFPLGTWLHFQQVRDNEPTVPSGLALLKDPPQSWVPYIQRNTLLSPQVVRVRDNIYDMQPNTHPMHMGAVMSKASSSLHTYRKPLVITALPYRATSISTIPRDSEHPPDQWDPAVHMLVSVLICPSH